VQREALLSFQADQVRPWIPQTEAFIIHIASFLVQDDRQAQTSLRMTHEEESGEAGNLYARGVDADRSGGRE
jgi:hypothetical protein